jgi:hypothetical protein
MGNDSNILDSVIWKHLPHEIVRKIVLLSDPSIDTRLYFKIPPRRLDERKSWRLWYLLKSHDGIIYNLETSSLHIFRVPGKHIIHRLVELNIHDEWMTILNENEKPHSVETYDDNGDCVISCSTDVFYTELRVLLKGSRHNLANV